MNRKKLLESRAIATIVLTLAVHGGFDLDAQAFSTWLMGRYPDPMLRIEILLQDVDDVEAPTGSAHNPKGLQP